MGLPSSAYVSKSARFPEFQALGRFGSKSDVTVSKLVFSSLYLAIDFMRKWQLSGSLHQSLHVNGFRSSRGQNQLLNLQKKLK